MLLTYYALIVNWLVQGQQFFNSVRIYSCVNSYRLGYSDPKDVLVTTFSGLLCQGEVLQSCVARAAVLHFPLGGASIFVDGQHDSFGVLDCPHLYWAKKTLVNIR